MSQPRPHSPAAERNQTPILAVLRGVLPSRARVLEIGAGTGQHAVHFSSAMPGWRWLPTNHPAELDTLIAGLAGLGRDNLEPPAPLDCRSAADWPDARFDAIYAANVAHIAPERAVRDLLIGAAEHLRDGGRVILYGPFKRRGQHTSPSNADFDRMLRARGEGSGVRDLADLDRWATDAGLVRVAELGMPANNLILIFEPSSGPRSDSLDEDEP